MVCPPSIRSSPCALPAWSSASILAYGFTPGGIQTTRSRFFAAASSYWMAGMDFSSFSGIVPRSSLKITQGEERLGWFHTQKARRGFCPICGSSLFFDPLDRQKHDWIGITLGTIDGATDTTLRMHIFVANKGDYYEIADGLPQKEQ